MSNQDGLKRSSPESQGIRSATIGRLIDYFAEKELELHSIMLLRHGKVVAEGWWHPYSAERPHMLFSLSKSFTSTAIGLAVEEGLLTVNDRVCDFFPEQKPERIGPNLARMTIHHLLSMSTGHEEDTSERVFSTPDGDWVKAFLSLDVEREPGTHFVYNTAATYMLAAILHKVTGQSLVDYLTPRLFEPLGITGATWETCPRGINTGGFGLNIKTADIAKFGQLYLQNGVWQGKQLIPSQWIEEATKKQINNGTDPLSDWNQGYGYQFWRCQHYAYRGDGAFGQFCIVVPEKELVVAITSGVNDMQAVMNGIWDLILPELSPVALPENEQERERLQTKLGELALPILPAKKHAHAQEFSGRYVFPENDLKLEAAALKFDENSCHITLTLPSGEADVSYGYGYYEQGYFPHREGNAFAYSCATWRDDQTLELMSRLAETPFTYTIRCEFTPGHLELKVSVNCSFGPLEVASLHGTLE